MVKGSISGRAPTTPGREENIKKKVTADQRLAPAIAGSWDPSDERRRQLIGSHRIPFRWLEGEVNIRAAKLGHDSMCFCREAATDP